MHRRNFLFGALALGLGAGLPELALAADTRQAMLGAAWRGPNQSDRYFAGALVEIGRAHV